jgi:hypothetical protein
MLERRDASLTRRGKMHCQPGLGDNGAFCIRRWPEAAVKVCESGKHDPTEQVVMLTNNGGMCPRGMNATAAF